MFCKSKPFPIKFIPFNFHLVRTWQCDRFPKWLQKTYHIEGMDFCEVEWNKEFFNSQPTCDDDVLPKVVFYDLDDNVKDDLLCQIDMNGGIDMENPETADLTKLCHPLVSVLKQDIEGNTMVSNENAIGTPL